MAEALTLKYRPQKFDEVIGQGVTAEILQNSLDKEEYAPSYLFYGTRGTGKTSTARIVAKGLNCENSITGSPCNKCPSCISIMDGTNPDIYEIDGASNRGIGDVREIQEKVRYVASGRFKVFIIDEAQMLTREAFNAFLKTLEEPPENTVFILATTDYQALPTTVVSRCQKYLFKAVDTNTLRNHIAFISQMEQIPVGNDILTVIAKYAEGSVRDAIAILEQLKFLGREATPVDIVQLLGIVPKAKTKNLLAAIGKKDYGLIFEALDVMKDDGEDFKRVSLDLLKQARNVLIATTVQDPRRILGIYSDSHLNEIKKLATLFSPKELIRLAKSLNESYTTMQYGTDMKIALEMAIFNYMED